MEQVGPKNYKMRHDFLGKVMYWKLCKKFKFGHINKGYMHKQRSILEKGMHK